LLWKGLKSKKVSIEIDEFGIVFINHCVRSDTLIHQYFLHYIQQVKIFSLVVSPHYLLMLFNIHDIWSLIFHIKSDKFEISNWVTLEWNYFFVIKKILVKKQWGNSQFTHAQIHISVTWRTQFWNSQTEQKKTSSVYKSSSESHQLWKIKFSNFTKFYISWIFSF
jgi:hypothetical protein